MDIDQLLAQSVHKVIARGCVLCDPPDWDGLADYIGRLEDIERSQAGLVNRTGTYRTLKQTWDLPVGGQTVSRHFDEHCGH